MASQTQGIQQLLTAEKKAADKVSEARKRKWFIARPQFALGFASHDGLCENFCLHLQARLAA